MFGTIGAALSRSVRIEVCRRHSSLFTQIWSKNKLPGVSSCLLQSTIAQYRSSSSSGSESNSIYEKANESHSMPAAASDRNIGGRSAIRGAAPFSEHENQSASAGSGPYAVKMDGLPYESTEQDVIDFFAPIPTAQIRIPRMLSGRASGKAYVEFSTHEDFIEAMKRDRKYIGSRYIILREWQTDAPSNDRVRPARRDDRLDERRSPPYRSPRRDD